MVIVPYKRREILGDAFLFHARHRVACEVSAEVAAIPQANLSVIELSLLVVVFPCSHEIIPEVLIGSVVAVCSDLNHEAHVNIIMPWLEDVLLVLAVQKLVHILII